MMTVSETLISNPFILSNTTDVTIDFEETSYSLSEGNATDICLNLTGTAEVDVSVDLHIEQQSASMCISFCD